jgi:ComF family protein
MHCQPQHKGQVYIWLKNNQLCLLCGEASDTQLPICTPCESELPWLGDACQICALPLPINGLTCGQCLKVPPAFTQVVAPWTYGFPIDSLITRFKHSANWPYGHLLAELLVQSLHFRFSEDLPRPCALIPVPLSRKRLRRRGFNQAAMLARWLSDNLEIACDEQLVIRTQDTSAQQDLNAKARQHNLRRAFALHPQATIRGRHLALVDDVLTTGATARTLARLLMDAGASRVDVYCLARTAKPGDPA